MADVVLDREWGYGAGPFRGRVHKGIRRSRSFDQNIYPLALIAAALGTTVDANDDLTGASSDSKENQKLEQRKLTTSGVCLRLYVMLLIVGLGFLLCAFLYHPDTIMESIKIDPILNPPISISYTSPSKWRIESGFDVFTILRTNSFLPTQLDLIGSNPKVSLATPSAKRRLQSFDSNVLVRGETKKQPTEFTADSNATQTQTDSQRRPGAAFWRMPSARRVAILARVLPQNHQGDVRGRIIGVMQHVDINFQQPRLVHNEQAMAYLTLSNDLTAQLEPELINNFTDAFSYLRKQEPDDWLGATLVIRLERVASVMALAASCKQFKSLLFAMEFVNVYAYSFLSSVSLDGMYTRYVPVSCHAS